MVVLQGRCFELGFMPSNHYSGSDTSRPEMGIMGIVNRVRGMQITENGFHVRMMFLLLGLLLSIVNLPTASGQTGPLPPPGDSDLNPITSPQPPPSPPPPSPSPPSGVQDQPSPSQPGAFLPPGASPRPGVPPPSYEPALEPPPPPPSAAVPAPSPVESDPTGIVGTGGDTWNESEKAGVVIASIAALLQVAVVAFLLIKRHQMLTTVEYDDIEDLEYDIPPDSNFRDIESA